MSHKKALMLMNYNLNKDQSNNSITATLKSFWPFLRRERKNLVLSTFALLLNSGLNLIAPLLVGISIDQYFPTKNFQGITVIALWLLLIFVGAFVANYFQTKIMGGVAQRLVYNLRSAIFDKIQDLPVAFFNQNKAGDLISRINSDTEKINVFFSQGLMQFVGNIFIMTGAAIFLLVLNFKLGILALSPAVLLLIFTQLTSLWIKNKNAVNLKAVGNMSAEIQESLDNFKVIVAFNRRDYFRQRFTSVNESTFNTSVSAGYANNIFTPVYGLAGNIGQILVLFYGIYLISQGDFSIGLLVSYISYCIRFYDPIRHIASLWSSFQTALAGWDRVSEILILQSDLAISTEKTKPDTKKTLISFQNVSFQYPEGKAVLKNINFELQVGLTYALVGPTGGGKTTTASLMARLFDPTAGTVLLDGKNIKTFSDAQRSEKIGFILQEPFLFSGTIRENIIYGNSKYIDFTSEQLEAVLHKHHLEKLLEKFDEGLDTSVDSQGDKISLGQRQLIAFMRAVLREPDLLILDEATANIDTITEQLLDDILSTLPKTTTKVIIAHRLNTIEDADEIFFVNGGEITKAGSLKHAISLLLDQKRAS